jgi:hypothetical protein
LAHAHARRHQGTQLFHRRQRYLVVDTGEGFADVEALPLAIEVAVIVVGKLGISFEFARKQTAGQGNARQDADLLELGLGEEHLRLPAAGESS